MSGNDATLSFDRSEALSDGSALAKARLLRARDGHAKGVTERDRGQRPAHLPLWSGGKAVRGSEWLG